MQNAEFVENLFGIYMTVISETYSYDPINAYIEANGTFKHNFGDWSLLVNYNGETDYMPSYCFAVLFKNQLIWIGNRKWQVCRFGTQVKIDGLISEPYQAQFSVALDSEIRRLSTANPNLLYVRHRNDDCFPLEADLIDSIWEAFAAPRESGDYAALLHLRRLDAEAAGQMSLFA